MHAHSTARPTGHDRFGDLFLKSADNAQANLGRAFVLKHQCYLFSWARTAQKKEMKWAGSPLANASLCWLC